MSRAKPLTIRACACRWSSLTRTGGWRWPNSGSSPPLELKWLATTITVLPFHVNSPASGLRLVVNAVFPGSMRPGLNVRCASPRLRTTPVEVVDVPPRPSTDAQAPAAGRVRRRAARPIHERQPAVGPEQEALADVAAGRPAVLVVDRIDLPVLVGRSALRLDRGDQRVPGHAGVRDRAGGAARDAI